MALIHLMKWHHYINTNTLNRLYQAAKRQIIRLMVKQNWSQVQMFRTKSPLFAPQSRADLRTDSSLLIRRQHTLRIGNAIESGDFHLIGVIALWL